MHGGGHGKENGVTESAQGASPHGRTQRLERGKAGQRCEIRVTMDCREQVLVASPIAGPAWAQSPATPPAHPLIVPAPQARAEDVHPVAERRRALVVVSVTAAIASVPVGIA